MACEFPYSGAATLRTATHLLLTYLLTYCDRDSRLTDEGDDLAEELLEILRTAVRRRDAVIRHRDVIGEVQRDV